MTETFDTNLRKAGPAAAFAIVLASIPADAGAEDTKSGDGRWYVGLGIPVAFIDDTESTTTGGQTLDPRAPTSRFSYRSTSTTTYKTGFKVSGTVGYEFGGGLRIEGESFFARAAVDTATYKGVVAQEGLSLPLTVRIPISGSASQFGAFASAWYDIQTGSDWIPYVGGGLGVIRIDQGGLNYDSQKLFRDTIAEAKASGAPGTADLPGPEQLTRVPEISTTVTVPAYHFGIGTGYQLNDNVILQVGYRQQIARDPSFEGSNPFGTLKVDTALRAHFLEIGLRYRF